jgi:hypothetical protein
MLGISTGHQAEDVDIKRTRKKEAGLLSFL